MDLIKGLSNGFFHTWECGDSTHRTDVFKKEYKEYVDKGLFIRDIQPAPRDARYKIDHYYREGTTEEYTVAYPNLDFHEEVLKKLKLDESFDWKTKLVDCKGEYSCGDFTIGYKEFYDEECEFSFPEFYFTYKGKINCLDFDGSNGKVVDYSDSFWAEYKNQPTTYQSVDDLLHDIRYFMRHKRLI